MWRWGEIIEDRIRSAQDDGMFDNLRGAGKPFTWTDESTGEDWLGNHLLHENGFLPDWLELRKGIEAERPGVRAARDDYWRQRARLDPDDRRSAALLDGLEREYIRRAREINRKIDEHNLRCPSIGHELARYPEDAIRRRLAAEKTERAQRAGRS